MAYLLVFWCGSAAAAEPVWSGLNGGGDGNRSRTASPGGNPDTIWRVDDAYAEIGCIAADHDRVYAPVRAELGGGVGLRAFAVDSGELLWESPTHLSGTAGCALTDGAIVVHATQNLIRAYDAATGAPSWSLPAAPGSGYSVSMVLSGDRIFAQRFEAGVGWSLVALNAESGAPVWSQPIRPGHNGPPLVAAGVAIAQVATSSPTIAAFRVSDGTQVWSAAGTYLTQNGPVGIIAEGRVIVSDFQARTVNAYDVESGATAWTVPFPGSSEATPPSRPNAYVADAETVYVTTAPSDVIGAFLLAGLRAEDGGLLYSRQLDTHPPCLCLANGSLARLDNSLFAYSSAYSPETGALLGAADLLESPIRPDFAAFIDGRVFFAAESKTKQFAHDLVAAGEGADETPPSVQCAKPSSAWHGSNVVVACVATDDDSGLADTGDAEFTLATSVGEGEQTSSASTGSLQVCDLAGNCATAGPFTGIRVDRAAPTIAVSTPQAGADYWFRATVTASYQCADGGGSGVLTCAGTVADGQPLDVSVGPHAFTVAAEDLVGNVASETVAYAGVHAPPHCEARTGHPPAPGPPPCLPAGR